MIFIAPTPLPAQDASAYVPLAHWGMPYVEHWIAAGRIADPTPLTRPLRAADLVRALDAMDTLALSGGERRIARALHADLYRREQGPWARLGASAGGAVASHPFRDPLELDRGVPTLAGDTSRVFASGGLELRLAFGPLVAVSHPYFDTRLKYDPDWFGKKDRFISGRTAEAYVSAQWRYAELFFGRLDQNWGPSVTQGLLLSENPYGPDHLGFSLGTTAVQIQGYVTQLDTRNDSLGTAQRRFMVQHRLWLRPQGRWTVALWEGLVWAGADRGLEPWYLNALNLGILEQVNNGTNVNSFVGLDFERRGMVTLFGQLMLDDIQVDRKTPTDQKPTSYGVTVGAKGPFLLDGGSWTIFYSQVGNLTYRNEDNLQAALYHSLGLGRNFSDYDQATARAALVAGPGLLLSPEATLVRQGTGDPRLPHPDVAAYPTTATLFQGVVERIVRLALGARWQSRSFGITADGGVHFISNDGHVSGASRTRWVGSIGVELRLRTQSALP